MQAVSLHVVVVRACLLVLGPAPALAANVSASKLSIHLIDNYSAGAQQIVAAHPRVIKILDTGGAMLSAARAYKAGTPGGRVVLRVYTQKHYTSAQDPATSAADFWNTVLNPAVSGLSAADRALIDYLEGPNECESTPCWSSVPEAQWFSSFWQSLAPLIADAGFRPCAFSVPVGNPPGDITYVHQVLDAIVPALRVCKQRNGGWSYHAYTMPYTTDVGTEMWYSLRYRQYYNYFAQSYPDLTDLPLLLTEGGVDTGGSPLTSGWQAHGDAAKYQNWLAWFDDRLREDPYVVGCTLFQIGTSNWPSFELEPIAGWMATHLNSVVSPVIECDPASISAEGFPGTTFSRTFTVRTSASGSTLNYEVTEDAPWLGASPSGGTSTGEFDTITLSFNTAGLSLGTHTATVLVSDPLALAVNTPQAVSVSLQLASDVPGDYDGDRDVDMVDFDAFYLCVNGAGLPFPTGCAGKDLDDDEDVDSADFGYFQRCMTGSGRLGSSGCTGLP